MERTKDRGLDKYIELLEDKLPVVYRSDYNISFLGFERLHPFNSKKYGQVVSECINKGLFTSNQIIAPDLITREDLLLIHTEEYLESLKSSSKLAPILEIGLLRFIPNFILRSRVLVPMMYQTSGSILASYLSLVTGFAFNLGGGFHHASKDQGSGFCVYADISLAIAHLRRDNLIHKALIVDLDAHQGNGHERDHIDDPETYIYDAYNPHIYPRDKYAKRGISKEFCVTYEVEDSTYNKRIQRELEEIYENFKPDILIYNAGTDCLQNDPLGDLNISSEGIAQRDLTVLKFAIHRKIPCVYLFSGGYQDVTSNVIANSMEGMFSFLREEGKI